MRTKALKEKLKIVRGRCSCLAAKLPGRLATLLLVSFAGNPQPLFAQQPFPEIPGPRSRFSHSRKATSPGGQAIAREWFFLAYASDLESELIKSLNDWFDRDVGKSAAPPTVPMTIDLPSN